MSVRKITRSWGLLVLAGGLLCVGVVVAQAAGPVNHGNSGPVANGAPVPQAATTTNGTPTPAFTPFPQSQEFVAITPCRIVDTRSGGGPLAANSTRNFAVSGSAGFTAQGGNAAGCGIPATATAVAASIVAIAPPLPGYLTAWPAGTTKPLASVLNLLPGHDNNTGVTVQIRPEANPALSVFAGSPGSLNIVIDVNGYYEPQTHVIVLSSGQVWYGNSTHMTKLIHSAGTGTYTMIFDRSLTGCNVLAVDNGDQNVRAAVGWGGTSMTVNTYKLTAGSFVHGDQSFQVFVTC